MEIFEKTDSFRLNYLPTLLGTAITYFCFLPFLLPVVALSSGKTRVLLDIHSWPLLIILFAIITLFYSFLYWRTWAIFVSSSDLLNQTLGRGGVKYFYWQDIVHIRILNLFGLKNIIIFDRQANWITDLISVIFSSRKFIVIPVYALQNRAHFRHSLEKNAPDNSPILNFLEIIYSKSFTAA